MRRRVGLAVVISVVLGTLCFVAWVVAQYVYPFGAGFKPYGDPGGQSSPLTLSATDGRLYAGIGIVMAIFVLLNLSAGNRFGFLGGLWRGAVASVGGPFAWVLQAAFVSDAGSIGNRVTLVALMFVLSFAIWAMLGVPLFVGVIAGLLSWPARGILVRGENAGFPQVNAERLLLPTQASTSNDSQDGD